MIWPDISCSILVSIVQALPIRNGYNPCRSAPGKIWKLSFCKCDVHLHLLNVEHRHSNITNKSVLVDYIYLHVYGNIKNPHTQLYLWYSNENHRIQFILWRVKRLDSSHVLWTLLYCAWCICYRPSKYVCIGFFYEHYIAEIMQPLFWIKCFHGLTLLSVELSRGLRNWRIITFRYFVFIQLVMEFKANTKCHFTKSLMPSCWVSLWVQILSCSQPVLYYKQYRAILDMLYR